MSEGMRPLPHFFTACTGQLDIYTITQRKLPYIYFTD